MNNELDFIYDNCDRINERINFAARKAGRNQTDVKLIAVSKTVDIPRIQKALEWE